MSGNITLDKVSHYRVFYDIVKKITNDFDKLEFYMLLDAYRFDGLLPEPLSMSLELEIAFTAAKAIIDSEKE